MPGSIRSRAGCAAVAAALLAGCGGGAEPPDPGARGVAAAADATAARQAVLDLGTLPSGWSAQERPKGRSACLAAVRRGASAHAASPAFRKGSEQAQSAVSVFPTAAAARRAMERLVSDRTRRCYARESNERYRRGSGSPFERVQVQALEVRGFGAAGGGSRVRFSPSKADPSIDVVIDLIALRVGRAVGVELLIGSPTPLDASLRARIARRHVALLRAGFRDLPGGLPT